jgi:HEAT repeat protein
VELLNDEESSVRVSALEGVSELLNFWSEDCCKKQVFPLVRGFYEVMSKAKDWTLIEGGARLLGRMCHGLKG